MLTTNNWSKEILNKSIIETGYTKVFNYDGAVYVAIAYPAAFGELKHIYQNGLYMFDLLPSFEKTEFIKNNVKYLLYKYPEEMLVENDKFEFLWKDRK